MIKSFRDRDTERYYKGERVRRFAAVERKQAASRFAYLDAANRIEDLMAVRGNRFEALSGRAGTYSIRINRQWRLEFEWDEGPAEVAITKHYGK